MAPESAAAVAATEEGSITSLDGTRLAYRAWPASSSGATATTTTVTFAVLHGLGEHAGRYDRFARGMAPYGMATYALDLRGHGKSDGQRGHVDSWSQWIDDAAAFVTHVETRAQGEVVPLGHSFGGNLLLSTIRAGRLPNARRFVVSAPALRLKVRVPAWKSSLATITSRLLPRMSIPNGVDAATVSRIPEVVEAYRTDPLVHSRISSRLYAEWATAAAENLARAGEIKIPFLILAGSADPLIDSSGSEDLHNRAPDTSTLVMLEGRYHEPFNDLGSDEVFATLAEWVRK